MNTIVQAISLVIITLTAILLPFAAYLFAFVLNRLRHNVDERIVWENDPDGAKERREDRVTYTTTFFFALISLAIFGFAYTVWFNAYVFDALGFSASIALPAIYWTVVYAVTFRLGWLKCNSNRTQDNKDKE